ncbi:MAG: tRNA lysidine(34) synthetase TilS, partial [Anaerolineaceae bacterium]|nr:tRNA lysidine(34) synthetase TilS [Anaerolineaceae bacterium]
MNRIIREECKLQGDQPILVGVSGGPDSLCLLDVLDRMQYSLIIAHFDHNLRSNSGKEAQIVKKISIARNLPFVHDKKDVLRFAAEENLSIEEAARITRYRFLFEQAKKFSAQAIAVGHTADDQVETVLMHLLRGTGLSGLTGMTYRSHLTKWDPEIPVVRPLIGIWKEEILSYCFERNIKPVIDESNQDVKYLRNRLRHELMPYLERYNPKIKSA